MSVTADTITKLIIKYDTEKLDKALDPKIITEKIQQLNTFIEDHADKFKDIFQKYYSIYSDATVTVAFVHHKNKDITSCAQWSGINKTIYITIDSDDVNDSFVFEMLNAINEAKIGFNLEKEISELNSKLINLEQGLMPEKLCTLIIDKSKEFAMSQETREFHTHKAYSLFYGQASSTLESYLQEQDNPSEQCHGFTHTETYQYRFLKTVLDHSEKLLAIKVKGSISFIETVKKTLQEYITTMESEAEENLRDLQINREFFSSLVTMQEHAFLREELLKVYLKLKDLHATPENTPILTQYFERVTERAKACDIQYAPSVGALFYVNGSRFSMSMDQTLLDEMEKAYASLQPNTTPLQPPLILSTVPVTTMTTTTATTATTTAIAGVKKAPPPPPKA